MIHKGVRFAYAVIVVAAAAISFIVLRNFDDASVFGPSHVVAIFSPDGVPESEQVPDMVTKFARARGVNVGRLYWDPGNEYRERIYLAVGDQRAESTHWLRTGYPYFSRNARTDMRLYRELGDVDPTGYYLVYGGTDRAASDLLRKFERLGYRGRVDPLFSPQLTLQYFFGQGALLWCVVLVGLVVIVTVASAVVLNVRSYGIQRLQGQPFGRILGRDLRKVAAFCAVAVAGVSGVTLALLFWYNRWHQLETYALVAVCFLVGYAAAALASHTVTLALVCRGPILGAIKGELAARWTVIGSYVLRIAAVLMTLSVSTSAIASGLELRKEQKRMQAWAHAGDAYCVRIGNSAGGANRQGVGDRIGQWIRKADTRGEIVLAKYLPPYRSRESKHEVLVVNDSYLTKHAIRDAAGSRVRPDGSQAVRVLLPQRFSAESRAVATRIRKDVDGFNRRPDVLISELRIKEIANGQSVFAYGSPGRGHDLILRDPIIVVVNGSSGVVSDGNYMSWASQQAVIFDDPDRAMKSAADAGVGRYVLAVSPCALAEAQQYLAVKREVGIQVFNMVAAVGVLLITALGVSIVYCRRYAQTLFVKYISGWSFLRTHKWILLVECALASMLVLWTWQRTAASLRAIEETPQDRAVRSALALSGWEPAVAAAVALLSLTIIVVTLARTNSKFVKAHSATLA